MPKRPYKVSLYHQRLDATGRDLIRETLASTKWNVSATARALGIHRSSLVSTMRRLEIREGQHGESRPPVRSSSPPLVFVWLVMRTAGHAAWCEGRTSGDAIGMVRDPRLLAMCSNESQARSLVVRLNAAAVTRSNYTVPHSNCIPTEPEGLRRVLLTHSSAVDGLAVLRSPAYAAS